jgi:hypothetical protein
MSVVTVVVEKLARKSGVMLGNLPRAERLVALALAATVIAPDGTYDERAVSLALEEWLSSRGGFLDADRVELRRTLVDSGLWQRDDYGRGYRRGAAHDAELARVASEVDAIDASHLLDEARRHHLAERARRKSAHG